MGSSGLADDGDGCACVLQGWGYRSAVACSSRFRWNCSGGGHCWDTRLARLICSSNQPSKCLRSKALTPLVRYMGEGKRSTIGSTLYPWGPLGQWKTSGNATNPCAGATQGHSLPLGWNRAYSGSGAASCGCWSAGVLVRESSETQFRWPAILTGFRRPAATVFVLAPSFWWLCTKQPDGGFSYVDGDDAAVGSLGG